MSKLFETVDNFFDSNFESKEVFEKCSQCGEYDYLQESGSICNSCKRKKLSENAAIDIFNAHFDDTDAEEASKLSLEDQFKKALDYEKVVELEWARSFTGETQQDFINSSIKELEALKTDFPDHSNEIDEVISEFKSINEADISIDTDLESTHADATQAENYLINTISNINKDYNLDNIELAITDKGNIDVKGKDGKNIVTLDRSNFTDSDIDDLKSKGYFDSYIEVTGDTLTEEDEETDEEFVIYTTTQIAPSEYRSDEYRRVSSEEQASDIVAELRAQGIGATYKKLDEAEIPASQLDFKHEQLAKVQADIEVIAGLKAEDTSNSLYTDLLDAYDKVVEILTDAISEDPVGTVIGSDKEDTGLTVTTDNSEVNIDIDDTEGSSENINIEDNIDDEELDIEI